jgi:UrcA family protein
MKFIQMFGAMALLATAGAATAQADVMVTSDYLKMGWEQVSAQVPYGDLNLATDKGVATLRDRVKAEAGKMCGVSDGTARNTMNKNTCYESVMASAEPQIVKLASDARAR